jgi:GTP-binding protein
MSALDIQKVEFVRSAAGPAGFPNDELPRCVFVGRSNVGKSSTLNALVGRKNFARVSAMPGKTVFVNLFLVDRRVWLVDLPGYGYSRAGQAERARYSGLIEDYFDHDRGRIRRLFLIVDARHKPSDGDVTMMDYARGYALPTAVIANKVDKLKPAEVEPSLAVIRQTLQLTDSDPLLPFSAEKKTGRNAVLADLFAACGIR